MEVALCGTRRMTSRCRPRIANFLTSKAPYSPLAGKCYWFGALQSTAITVGGDTDDCYLWSYSVPEADFL